MSKGGNSPAAVVNELRGQPFLGLEAYESTTGNIWWVSSTHSNKADDPSNGFSPVMPFATINYAITQCVAANKDVIYVMPGHAEAITAAGGITLSVSGVKLIGLGKGASRPTITFTTSTAATFLITGANTAVENFIFSLVGIDALVGPIAFQAADIAFRGNRIVTGDATNQATLGILTSAAADKHIIEDNEFVGSGDAGTATAVRVVGTDGGTFRRNRVYGAYTTTIGGFQNVTTACTNYTFQDNIIDNRTASSTKAAVFVSTSTGVIRGNTLSVLTGTAPLTGAAMVFGGSNAFTNAVATEARGLVDGNFNVLDMSVKTIVRATAALPTTATTAIFTISGGPIVIENLVGEVTTAIQNQACNLKANVTDTASSTTTDICADLATANKAVGSFYNITGTFATAMVVTAGGTAIGQAGTVVAPIGTINLTTSATNTGSVRWFLRYRPLSPASAVVAA